MLAQAVERTFGRASAALSSSLSGRAMRADVFGKRAVDRLVQGHGDSRCYVMAGLVPAIHVLVKARRGCATQGQA
jgi:hypothetical protein